VKLLQKIIHFSCTRVYWSRNLPTK